MSKGWAQAPQLPKEVAGKAGAFIKIPAVTSGKEVRWFAADAGLELFPVELLRDTKTAVVLASQPGRYRLLAWTAIEGTPTEAAVCVVVVGDPPNPPTPPSPVPPSDPLVQALQAAYQKEDASTRGSLKTSLAALYREGAKVAAREDITTWGQLYSVMSDAAKSLGVSGTLPQIQGVIQEELKKILSTDKAAALDSSGRTKAAQVFGRVADALEAVK